MASGAIGGKIVSKRDSTISDLPKPVFENILLKVSLKNILICKRVCRSWRQIISDRQFGYLYFAGNDVYVLLHPTGTYPLLKKFFFFNPENYKWNISNKFGGNMKFNLHFNSYYTMFNTCNGFICFSDRNTIAVSNPVTEEYAKLPRHIKAKEEYRFVCGLGFCRVTKNYKVVLISGCDYSKRWTNCPATTIDQCSYSSYAQVLTLSSGVWKNVGSAPLPRILCNPIFLNGTLYWPCDPILGSKYIHTFDFTDYLFRTCSLPPSVQFDSHLPRIGILKDQLCCCDASEIDHLEIWLMSEISSQGGWTKLCNVSLRVDLDISRFGCFQPISCLTSGAIVLFHFNMNKSGIVYYDPERQWVEYEYITADGVIPENIRKNRASKEFQVIHFSPTLASLNDVFIGDREDRLNNQVRERGQSATSSMSRSGTPNIMVHISDGVGQGRREPGSTGVDGPR